MIQPALNNGNESSNDPEDTTRRVGFVSTEAFCLRHDAMDGVLGSSTRAEEVVVDEEPPHVAANNVVGAVLPEPGSIPFPQPPSAETTAFPILEPDSPYFTSHETRVVLPEGGPIPFPRLPADTAVFPIVCPDDGPAETTHEALGEEFTPEAGAEKTQVSFGESKQTDGSLASVLDSLNEEEKIEEHSSASLSLKQQTGIPTSATRPSMYARQQSDDPTSTAACNSPKDASMTNPERVGESLEPIGAQDIVGDAFAVPDLLPVRRPSTDTEEVFSLMQSADSPQPSHEIDEGGETCQASSPAQAVQEPAESDDPAEMEQATALREQAVAIVLGETEACYNPSEKSQCSTARTATLPGATHIDGPPRSVHMIPASVDTSATEQASLGTMASTDTRRPDETLPSARPVPDSSPRLQDGNPLLFDRDPMGKLFVTRSRRRCSNGRILTSVVLLSFILAVSAFMIVLWPKFQTLKQGGKTPTPSPTWQPSAPPFVRTGAPVRVPTSTSSSLPSTVASQEPTQDTSIQCFEGIGELQGAVDAYLIDGTRWTDTARTYGWPIGQWCIDRLTRLDSPDGGLFSAIRNPRASDFNEDLSGWNVAAVTDMSALFQGASSFNQNLSTWDTSSLTAMTRMFYEASSFNGDIGSWDVSKVQLFVNAFRGATSFNQNLLWDVRNASTMSNMFEDATSFNGDVSSWNPQSVVKVVGMFRGATAFNQSLSSWYMPQATYLDDLFTGATAFNGDVTTWNVSHVVSFRGVFEGCTSFNQDLSGWNVSSGRDFVRMFAAASSYNQDLCDWIPSFHGEGWSQRMFTETACDSKGDPQFLSSRPGPFCSLCDYSSTMPSSTAAPTTSLPPSSAPSATFFPSASSAPSHAPSASSVPSSPVLPCFEDVEELSVAVDDYLQDGPDSAAALEYGMPIGSWCVSKMTSFVSVFSVERNPLASSFNEDISQWNTSRVRNMAFLFRGAEAFNQDLSLWDTSLVASFESMFQDATGFNQNLSAWNTSSIRTLRSMFEGALTFNGRVDGWDTRKVESMESVFRRARAFNQDLSSWDVSRVQSMTRTFFDAAAFNQNLSSWNMGNVVETNSMFRWATEFDGDIQRWNISSVKNAHYMFAGATRFNQNLSTWELASDILLAFMFAGATAFNGDIGQWEVSTVENFQHFLRDAQSFNQDLSSWNVQGALYFNQMFDGAIRFQQDLCRWNISAHADTRVDRMFADTSCPEGQDPDVSVRPLPTLCFSCGESLP